jgi:hypothetical protein
VFESNHALQWARQVLLETIDEKASPQMTTEVRALAEEQLRKLQRPNTKGTKEQAVRQNENNVRRARDYVGHVSPHGNFKLPSLIVDGKGDPQLRAKVAAGLFPPTPFATHGMVGWNESANASWFREWCAAGSPMRAKVTARRAWHGGGMSSNKDAAWKAFQERKSNQQTAPPDTSDKQTARVDTVRSTQDKSRSFVGLCKILNPSGNSSTVIPTWVMELEKDLDTADSFWQ